MSSPVDISPQASCPICGRQATALVLYPDGAMPPVLMDEMRAGGWTLQVETNGDEAAARIYTEPPDLILMHSGLPPRGGQALCRDLKRDNAFSRIPIIMVFDEAELTGLPDWHDLPIDDYVVESAGAREIVLRLGLCLSRVNRDLDANPLTRLPGNNAIMRQLTQRIDRGEDFCAAYLDIDNFKAFNDCYGFGRGDEALQLTARLILNVVHSLNDPHSSVGHIGGDDFFFIVSPPSAERACQEILQVFDAIIPELYDAEDRRRGYIESVNRQGQKERFPIMSLSIAAATNVDGAIRHVGQVGSITKEIKKAAKQQAGSCYIIDRRRPGGENAKTEQACS